MKLSKKKRGIPWKIAIGVVAIAVAVLLLAKNKLVAPVVLPGSGLNGLVFQSPTDAKRMQTLDSCIKKFNPTGWQYHDDYKEIGNFYEASWCTGLGCKYPNKSDAQGQRDTYRITLTTTEYKLPQVYGVSLTVDFIPGQPRWGLNFSFASGMASTVTNDRLHINFYRYPDADGEAKEHVYVGSGDSYTIYETFITVPSPNTLEDDLVTLTSSPERMRDVTLTQLAELRKKVADTIASDTITRCTKTEQIRSNLPPKCIERSKLTGREKTVELQKANTYVDTQENLLNSYYKELYGMLVKVVPLKNCLYERI